MCLIEVLNLSVLKIIGWKTGSLRGCGGGLEAVWEKWMDGYCVKVKV